VYQPLGVAPLPRMQLSKLSNWFGRAAMAWVVSYAPYGWTIRWTDTDYSSPSSASTRSASRRPASSSARERRGE
jgi:hypothetical protein